MTCVVKPAVIRDGLLTFQGAEWSVGQRRFHVGCVHRAVRRTPSRFVELIQVVRGAC